MIPDRREAILRAVAEARDGDWILLAGKGHETYEICADGRHEFDERAIAREAFRLREIQMNQGIDIGKEEQK